MKIGILAHDFMAWSGGVDFLRTVTDSLLTAGSAHSPEFHLIIPDAGPKLAWRRIRHRIRRATRALTSSGPEASALAPPELVVEVFAEFNGRITIHHIDIGRRALARATERLGLDVVLPALHSLGPDFGRRWIGYAYDFRHKYFPQHFSLDDCRSRDEHFTEMLTQARAVIVNSRAAAADIARFVPQATARVFALPFAPAPGPDWLEVRPGTLNRYGVAPPFFMISNQFWVHKNHATAFDAFRIAAARDTKIALVCTGSTQDPRDPRHFPGLIGRVKEWGLEGRIQVLGLIPKRDQIEVMKSACAVIQPTLFEGGPGGGAVYDAISLGVPVIVSDIPVNREVEGENVDFFAAQDPAQLAALMLARLNAPPRERVPREELLARGRRRRAACGETLWNAIDFVTSRP